MTIIPTMNYRNHITIEPNKRGGKPCVRGLRITVYEVLEYLASEMTEAEILDDFPDLTILRTFFEAEAETRIPPLVFASVMMLKPAFHRWRFKIVRTVDLTREDLKACIAYAADRERRFMTAPSSA